MSVDPNNSIKVGDIVLVDEDLAKSITEDRQTEVKKPNAAKITKINTDNTYNVEFTQYQTDRKEPGPTLENVSVSNITVPDSKFKINDKVEITDTDTINKLRRFYQTDTIPTNGIIDKLYYNPNSVYAREVHENGVSTYINEDDYLYHIKFDGFGEFGEFGEWVYSTQIKPYSVAQSKSSDGGGA